MAWFGQFDQSPKMLCHPRMPRSKMNMVRCGFIRVPNTNSNQTGFDESRGKSSPRAPPPGSIRRAILDTPRPPTPCDPDHAHNERMCRVRWTPLPRLLFPLAADKRTGDKTKSETGEM